MVTNYNLCFRQCHQRHYRLDFIYHSSSSVIDGGTGCNIIFFRIDIVSSIMGNADNFSTIWRELRGSISHWWNRKMKLFDKESADILGQNAEWGKISVKKTFKEQQNICTFRISAISRAYGSPYP